MPDDRLAKISLLVLDVDGVLTDGSIYLNDDGVETKRFHVRDGTGLTMWRLMGNEVAIITGRKGAALQHRAAELKISHVMQGIVDKRAALEQLLQQLNRKPENTAIVADDIPELPLFDVCGYAMAVADASDEVKRRADFVTQKPGGHAAVREAIEHILKSRNEWDEAIKRFLNRGSS